MSSFGMNSMQTPVNTSFGMSMPCVAPNAVLRPYYVRLAEEPNPTLAGAGGTSGNNGGLFPSSSSRRAVVAMMDFWAQPATATVLQRNYVVLHLPVGGRVVAAGSGSPNAPYAHGTPAANQPGVPTTSAPVRYVVSQTLLRQCTAVADLLDDIDSVVPTRAAPNAAVPNANPTAASIAATLADQNFSDAAYPGGGSAGPLTTPTLSSSSPTNAGGSFPLPSSSAQQPQYSAATVTALKQFVQQSRGAAAATQVVTLSDALDEVFDAALDATPQLDIEVSTCEAVEALLEFCVRAVDLSPPSVLPRPLVCPLEYLIQPWEMHFLNRYCAGPSGTGAGSLAGVGCNNAHAVTPSPTFADSGVVLGAQQLTPRKSATSPVRSTTPGARRGSGDVEIAGAQTRAGLLTAASAPLVLPSGQTGAAARGSGYPPSGIVCPATATPAAIQVLRLADYLGQSHLRDLAAGYLASTLLAARTDADLAAALHIDRLPSDDELEAVFRSFPFLAPQGTSAPSPIVTPVAPTRVASAIAARRL